MQIEETQLLKQRKKEPTEESKHLELKLHSLLDEMRSQLPVKKLVSEKTDDDRPEIQNENNTLIVDNEISNSEDITVSPDPNKLVESSIFDFVMEMERQFDDIFMDIQEIKKQEERRKKNM